MALQKAGRELTAESFIAALESIKDYKGIFGSPTMSFSATKHQGSNEAFLAQVKNGHWVQVGTELSPLNPGGDWMPASAARRVWASPTTARSLQAPAAQEEGECRAGVVHPVDRQFASWRSQNRPEISPVTLPFTQCPVNLCPSIVPRQR